MTPFDGMFVNLYNVWRMQQINFNNAIQKNINPESSLNTKELEETTKERFG